MEVHRVREAELLTNAFNFHFYPRAQDLVPAIDAPYQPAGAIEASCSAERVREGCCRCEVMLYGSALLLWSALTQLVDDVRDLGDYERLSVPRS